MEGLVVPPKSWLLFLHNTKIAKGTAMKALPFPPSFSAMPLTSPLILRHGQS